MKTETAPVRFLAAGTLAGLYFIFKYRFLTIAQFARIANFSVYHAAVVLRDLERRRVLGFFGYVSIPGQGRTPKVYYLKKRGFALLQTESDFLHEPTDTFTEVSKDATWSPQMYHRLRLIDLLIALELQLQTRPHLRPVKVFAEYRQVKRDGRFIRETMDFVGDAETAENRLIPDGAFVLENVETNRRALFFLEVDMGTEQLVSRIPKNSHLTLQHKFSQYDRYLTSLRFKHRYAEYGDFGYFLLLFVTTTEMRVENIRYEMRTLPEELAKYYRLTTFDAAMQHFFGPIWKSRSRTDLQLYPLVRGNGYEATYRTESA